MNTSRTQAAVAACLTDAATRIGESLMLDRQIARLEARVLATFAWNVPLSWLIAHDTDTLDHTQFIAFQTLLQRRLDGEPIAYITGKREFYGREFHVSPAVLIPRPETELLVELALARIPVDQAVSVLELGTGSGCIAITLTLERPLVRITAIDRSDAALVIAQINANALHAQLEFFNSDWFTALQNRTFDLIVSNPPYVATVGPHLDQGDVRFEPISALAAGETGMDDIQTIIRAAHQHLTPGGSLILEHGYNQGDLTRRALDAEGFDMPRTHQDLAGNDRVSCGENPKHTPKPKMSK
ncbi:MAG: peptide chain release factor N(5)-glutamine methyltransferase [Thiobacillaceae bacterium]